MTIILGTDVTIKNVNNIIIYNTYIKPSTYSTESLSLLNVYNAIVYNTYFNNTILVLDKAIGAKIIASKFTGSVPPLNTLKSSSNVYIAYSEYYNLGSQSTIQMSSSNNITICCSKIFSTRYPDASISIENSNNVKTINNFIVHVGYGVYKVYSSSDVYIVGNIILSQISSSYSAISVSGSHNIVVAYNFITNSYTSIISYSVSISKNSDINLTDNIIVNTGKPMYIGENSAIYVSHNDIYTNSQFCDGYLPEKTVVDPVYTYPGFYESYANSISDEYKGPGQDTLGQDNISDKPISLCRGVVSSYVSKIPVLYPEAQVNMISPRNVNIDANSMSALAIRRGAYTWFPIPALGNSSIEASFSIDMTTSRGILSIMFWNGTPVYPVNVNGYNYPKAVALEIRVTPIDGGIKLGVVYWKPEDGVEQTLYEFDLSKELLVGTYILRVGYNGSAKTLTIAMENAITMKRFNKSVDLPSNILDNIIWLGVKSNSTVKPMGMHVSGVREGSPPTLDIGYVSVSFEFSKETLTLPQIDINTIANIKTVTILEEKTVTVSITSEKTAVASTIQGVVIETRTPTNTVGVATIGYLLALTAIALVVVIVLSKISS